MMKELRDVMPVNQGVAIQDEKDMSASRLTDDNRPELDFWVACFGFGMNGRRHGTTTPSDVDDFDNDDGYLDDGESSRTSRRSQRLKKKSKKRKSNKRSNSS